MKATCETVARVVRVALIVLCVSSSMGWEGRSIAKK